MTPRQENKLIRRLKQRDEEAFRQMVLLYQHKVFHLVYRMMGNREEAEDLSQEIFVTVFKNIDAFRGDARFSTWLYRIATNQCKNRIKYLARRAKDRTQGLDVTPDGDLQATPLSTAPARPDRMVQGKELERAIQRALADLDDEHRALIVLRDIQGLPYAEIAQITGLNPGTVKSRLHRARVALKRRLGQRYDTD